MDSGRVVTQNPQVVYRDLAPGEGGVLLHLETAAYHGVNDVGARIWALVDGQRSVAAITEQLGTDLPDAAGQLPVDVNEFLTDMLERDLIR